MPKERKTPAKPQTTKPRTRSDVSAKGGAKAKQVDKPLTARQQRFVAEYLRDQNATAAYKRAGYNISDSAADTAAARLFGNVRVRAAIDAGMATLRQRIEEETGVSKVNLVRELWNIVTADARELVDYQRLCCRHCYGIGFGYQRTDAEMERDRSQHELKRQEDARLGEFQEHGGTGFDGARDPNPGCPECFGRGYGQVMVQDTRKLSPKALALYAGVKMTKGGIEVKMHSKLDAAEKIAKHLGLYEEDNKQKVDPLAALLAAVSRSAIPVAKNLPDDDDAG